MPPLNFGRIHFTRLYTRRRRSFHQPRRLRSLYSALGTAGHTKKKDFFRGLGVAMTKQYSAFKYLSRIEAAHLDILESKSPIDKTVILWWGLDGLQLNEDGTVEWISRKKPSPVQQNVFYRPFQTIISPPQYDMCQSTQAQIDALMAQNMQLQVQAWQAEKNRQMINALQSYVVRWPGYYERLTDCCCNQTRDRF